MSGAKGFRYDDGTGRAPHRSHSSCRRGETLIPTHDIIDNRPKHLVAHINRILTSTEAALSQAIIKHRGWVFPLPPTMFEKVKALKK